MKRLLALAALFAFALLLLLGSAADGQDKKKSNKAPEPPAKREATRPEALQTLPGFQVELLYTVRSEALIAHR